MINSLFNIFRAELNGPKRSFMPRRSALACALLAVVFLLPARAVLADWLTVEKAVEIALSGNPEVLAARIEVDAARGRTLQLKARPEPQLAASVEGVPLPGSGQDGAETEFSLGIE